jgi:hypothetical protein
MEMVSNIWVAFFGKDESYIKFKVNSFNLNEVIKRMMSDRGIKEQVQLFYNIVNIYVKIVNEL